MDPRVTVGIAGDAREREAAFRSFRLLELAWPDRAPPSPEAAERWRRDAPPGFDFTAKASERVALGGFGPAEDVAAAWAETLAIAGAIRATVIVFETPTTFGPTPANRDRLYAFFGAAKADAALAWEPRGPWPLHVVERVCEELHLQHATDPFVQELADQPRAYYRLHGPAAGSSYADEDLHRLLGFCEDVDRAHVVFAHGEKLRDALRFRDLAAQRW